MSESSPIGSLVIIRFDLRGRARKPTAYLCLGTREVTGHYGTYTVVLLLEARSFKLWEPTEDVFRYMT